MPFFIFRSSDTFEKSAPQPVVILGCLWVIFNANSRSEGYPWVPGVPGFAQRGDADHCWGCDVLQRSTGCLGKDLGHWQSTGSAFFVAGDVLRGIYTVWILMSIIGSLYLHAMDWLPLGWHLSFPSALGEAKVLVLVWMPGAGWHEATPYLREKSGSQCENHILSSGAGRGRAAQGLPWLPLPWERGVTLPSWNKGRLKARRGGAGLE